MQETGPILAVGIEYVAITSHLSLITICVEICAKTNIFICIHVNHHYHQRPPSSPSRRHHHYHHHLIIEMNNELEYTKHCEHLMREEEEITLSGASYLKIFCFLQVIIGNYFYLKSWGKAHFICSGLKLS
uniref:Uncharacterized protein n=1 Tax=Glossina palpalis gambiensis TaxID=67801 RepID=A0A1B0B809_9MUSC